MLGFRCLQVCLATAAGLLVLVSGQAFAQVCPGHPDAIGTSRTIVVDPAEHPRVGTMQYEETLPLRDHEVVLTFDDGPLPPNTEKILDILASQCVKVTYFLVGEMARAYPATARRMFEEGHTIGTHSENHPLRFDRISTDKVRWEIDQGIEDVTAALGDPDDVAPFFRIPGLLRSPAVDDYLAGHHLMTWSADFLADDWRHISSGRVVNLAMTRLEAKGKGILLLHDIHERTVAALPTILHDLKARNFHIVQIVPATADRPKTPTDPSEWHMRPQAWLATSRWPAVRSFAFASEGATEVAGVADLGVVNDKGNVIVSDAEIRSAPRQKIPLPSAAPWPRELSAPAPASPSQLAAPAEQLFRIGFGPDQPQKAVISPPPPISSGRAESASPSTDYTTSDREAMNELVRDTLAVH